MNIEILRKPEVLKTTGKTPSALDRDIADGFFPKSIRLSPDPLRRAVGWPGHEVEAVVRALIAGSDANSIRQLVAELTAARKSAAGDADILGELTAAGNTARLRKAVRE